MKTAVEIAESDIEEGYVTRTNKNGQYLGPGTSVQPGDILAIRISARRVKFGRLPIIDALGRHVASTRFTRVRPQHITGDEPWRDGAGFEVTVRWQVPSDLKSGVYFIAGYKPLFFVVRDAALTAEVVVLVSTSTFNAYSLTHGRSVYRHPEQVPVVSFNRPQNLLKSQEWLPMVRWLEKSKFAGNIRYITDFDLESGEHLQNCQTLLVLPHSEYWTRNARLNVDEFVARGGDLIVASGNAMWWQVRIEGEYGDQLACYKRAALKPVDKGGDPVTDPALKTTHWHAPSLKLDTVNSVGGNFLYGGYGKIVRNRAMGHGGLRVADPGHPLLRGQKVRKKEFLPIYWAREFDGAPVRGFDVDGVPIVDTAEIECAAFNLIMYEWCYRAGHTVGTMHVMRKTAESGFVLHMGAKDICFIFENRRRAFRKSGRVLHAVLRNAIATSLEGKSPFYDQPPRQVHYDLRTPIKGSIPPGLRKTTKLSDEDPRPGLGRKRLGNAGLQE